MPHAPCRPSLAVSPAQGCAAARRLADKITAGDAVIPRPSLTALKPLVEQWRALHARIDELEARLVARAGSDERMRRLMQIPGVGPLTAHAVVTAIGDPKRFSTGRDFAAWAGLTPLTDSSAEKTRIGHISRQGDHSLRRLMVLGAANWRAMPKPSRVRPMPGSTASSRAGRSRSPWSRRRPRPPHRLGAAAFG